MSRCFVYGYVAFTIFSSLLAQEGQDLDGLINNVFKKPEDDLDAVIGDVFSKPGKVEVTTPNTRNPEINLQPSPGTSVNSNSGNCDCVPYYLCNNSTIITNGVGLIDIRINDGQCENYLELCCNGPDKVENPITPPPDTKKESGCGFRNANGVGFRITGDKNSEAQFGEFPWMVAVLREEAVEGNPQKLNVYQCGGALIHPEVVITAAHCVGDKEKHFKIRAGEWDTQTRNELYPHQDRDVKTIISHPQYYAGALYNDIALLFLQSPVEIAENVNVVCLPPQGTVIDGSTRCFASGWGKDVFGKEGRYQVILKKIELPIVPNPACQESLRTTRLGKFFELHRSFICAGGEPGMDTCKGDGGSPLVCPIPGHRDRYHHAGIVAWGIGCGENNVPGVYANVALFREWIDEQLGYKNLDLTTYQY